LHAPPPIFALLQAPAPPRNEDIDGADRSLD
jgi:hypothetical protein